VAVAVVGLEVLVACSDHYSAKNGRTTAGIHVARDVQTAWTRLKRVRFAVPGLRVVFFPLQLASSAWPWQQTSPRVLDLAACIALLLHCHPVATYLPALAVAGRVASQVSARSRSRGSQFVS
jgi:hypothetical protein